MEWPVTLDQKPDAQTTILPSHPVDNYKLVPKVNFSELLWQNILELFLYNHFKVTE